MSETARRTRKLPWLLLGTLAVAAVAGGAYALYGPGLSLSRSPADRWKAAGPADRMEVAQKLIAGNLLIGKSREEVLRDLGPPDRTDEAQGTCEWQVGVETKMGRDAKDRSALQDEASYLKVKFVAGVATFANISTYITDHQPGEAPPGRENR
ncbi:MAG TPA: hypothetical protein VFG68_00895 [Fimbriiglobus sp.]|nr:hypothetical protein [Fimbriiglobus sp.]